MTASTLGREAEQAAEDAVWSSGSANACSFSRELAQAKTSMRPLSPTRFCSLPFPKFLLRCPLLILPPSHQSVHLAFQFPSARTVNLARTGIRQLPLALLDRSSAGSSQSLGAGNPGIRCTHSGPLPPESWVDLTPLFHVRRLVVIVRIHSPHLLFRIPGSRLLQLRGFEAAESSASSFFRQRFSSYTRFWASVPPAPYSSSDDGNTKTKIDSRRTHSPPSRLRRPSLRIPSIPVKLLLRGQTYHQ